MEENKRTPAPGLDSAGEIENRGGDNGSEELYSSILNPGTIILPRPDYINSLPWIQRERVSFGEFCRLAEENDLPEPTERDWTDTFNLTQTELDELKALNEAYRFDHAELQDLRDHFFVRKFGNKPRVCWRDNEGRLGHMSVPEMKTAYLEKRVEIMVDGELQHKPLVDLWLHDRKTRRYERVEFLPGRRPWEVDDNVYNLWAGWPDGLPRERDLKRPRIDEAGFTKSEREFRGWDQTIWDDDELDTFEEPKQCNLFLTHMHENMCGGDDEVFQFLLGWIADALVKPGLSEVAVVMTGPSGSGKGTFANLIGSLFGPHFLAVNHRDQIIGKFNRHLMECQMLFGDEVDFRSSDEANKILRNVVTEPNLQIEPKGVDAFTAKKWFRLMIATNESHIVGALKDDRRYLVLNVDAGEHNNHRGYFAKIRDEWKNGGQVAFFRWLSGRAWSDEINSGRWHAGHRPETDALTQQKVLSLSPQDQFLLGILQDGVLPGTRPINRSAPPGTVLSRTDKGDGVLQVMKEAAPQLRDVSWQVLATYLKDWGCKSWRSGNERGWTFPALAAMRDAWDTRLPGTEWPNGSAWMGDRSNGGEEPY